MSRVKGLFSFSSLSSPWDCPNALRLTLLLLSLATLLLLLPALPAIAQSFDAKVEFFVVTPEEEKPFTVGDYITLRLELKHPADSQASLPRLEEQWAEFEVIDQSEPTTVRNSDGSVSTGKDIVVALYEPGTYQTPRLVVTHFKADGSVEELGAPVIPLKIESVLVEGDTELRDLKPQAELPVPPLWPWILAGLLLALLLAGILVGAGLWLYHRRKQQAPMPVPVAPIFDPRPPEVIAYAELDRIETLNLPAKNQIKEHYSLVTNCLRRYIEGRYHIPALERTTSEIHTSFTLSSTPVESIRDFLNVFTEGDFVKFARYRPGAQQAYSLVPKARAIVKATTPEPEPVVVESSETEPEVVL